MEEKDIYKMKLFETMYLLQHSNYYEQIRRVPGGWVFIRSHMDGEACCFIPFNNEYQNK